MREQSHPGSLLGREGIELGNETRLQQVAMGGDLHQGCDCCLLRTQVTATGVLQDPPPPPEGGHGCHLHRWEGWVWELSRLARTQEGVCVISPGPAAARWG